VEVTTTKIELQDNLDDDEGEELFLVGAKHMLAFHIA
jgi:hypothetical protein